jgi:serine/threonine protein kinase
MPVDLGNLPDCIRPTADELAKKFEFEKDITKGCNGYVLVGRNMLTRQKIVVKFYYWGDGAHLEPRTLCDLASPHTLRVLDAAAIDKDNAYFVTEYCEHGDLDEHLESGRIGVRRAVEIILNVATGVNEIHSAGFIHRDLKPSNVFCRSDNKFVIGDFGSVVKLNSNGFSETASKHSLIYRTPEEVATGRAYPQGDIYQIGLILYQLLGGVLHCNETEWLSEKQLQIYQAFNEPEDQLYASGIIEKKIAAGKIVDYSSFPAWIPEKLVRVVRKCCRVNPEDRHGSVSDLIVQLSNLRSSLPDWRLEPEPVLHKRGSKFRLTQIGAKYVVEKKSGEHAAWRKQNKHAAMTLYDAVKLVEGL